MKTTLVSFCTETKANLLDLANRTSRYQLPIAGRYRIIDWVISNSVNVGAQKIILFEKFFPEQLHEFLETYLLAERTPDIKILERKNTNIFEDFHSVVYNEESDVFVIYNGDNPAFADFKNAIEKFNKLNVPACIFKVYYTEASGEIFKILIAKKEILLHFLETLVKRNMEIPIPFEAICNAMINEGMPEEKISGYYKFLDNIHDYFKCNMEFIKNIRFFNNLFTKNPLGSYLTTGGNAKIKRGSYVKNSLFAENCIIEGHVENSVIFPDVVINKGAVVKDSIILSNNNIGKKSTLIRVIIDEASEGRISPHPNIGVGAEIGRYNANTINSLFKSELFGGVTFIGKDCYLPRNIKIGSACYIKPQTDGNVFGKVDRVFDGQTV